ncbi:MAG TPA: hypothetical protein VNH44_06470 [Micropepsaceae bacterium]|nr:hypothetical protein [Micropepsaceae bacterium]
MAANRNNPRQARLAAALKENLKRRKQQERAKAAPEARALGTAPQAGLENKPEPGPKSAPKRH